MARAGASAVVAVTGDAETVGGKVIPFPRPRTLELSYGGARVALFLAKFCRQTKGRWAGKPLIVEPFQLEILSDLFRTGDLLDDAYDARDRLVLRQGDESPTIRLTPAELLDARRWLPKVDGWVRSVPGFEAMRVHVEALIGLARKNGKSTLSSGIALYLLVGDGEPGAEVYSAAASKDQARIVFEQAKKMVEMSPRLLDYCKVYKSEIVVKSTDSFYRVIAADAPTQEGLNPHGIVIDELHAHKTRELYDTLTTAQAAREQPLVVSITTAGQDVRNTIAGEQFTRGAGANPTVKDGKVVPRKDREPTFFFCWYSVPKTKRKDRTAWRAANPARHVRMQYLEQQAAKPGPASVFERYHLNLWTRGDGSWLKPGAWAACEARRVIAAIEDGDECYAGVDLGVKRDTAAVALDFPLLLTAEEARELGYRNRREELLLHRVRGFVWGVHADPRQPAPPAHDLTTGENAELEVSRVEAFLDEVAETYLLREVIFDPWGFLVPAQNLSNRGIVTVEFPQTNDRMCPASAALAEAIKFKHLAHNGDDVLAAHVEAAQSKDVGRSWRLTKDPKLIANPNDFCIALALAVYRAQTEYAAGIPSVTVVG